MKPGDFLIQKYNPYHAANGQFTTSGNAHYVNISIKRQNSGRQINVGEMLMREYKAKNQTAAKPAEKPEKIAKPAKKQAPDHIKDQISRHQAEASHFHDLAQYQENKRKAFKENGDYLGALKAMDKRNEYRRERDQRKEAVKQLKSDWGLINETR